MSSTPETHRPFSRPARGALLAASLLSATLAGGCQFSTERPVEPPQARPIIVDEAMQRRDWEPVVATYPSGAVLAGPTDFIFEPTMSPEGQVAEIPTFLGNVFAMPVAMFFQPPWTATLYRGVMTEPSYTKAEPYPEDIQAAQRQQQYAGSSSNNNTSTSGSNTSTGSSNAATGH